MIEIKRDGGRVVLHFDLAIPTYDVRSVPMSYNCGGEVYAGLLTQAMRDALGNTVAAARRAAYEQGWKDAKGKRAKEDWFPRVLK